MCQWIRPTAHAAEVLVLQHPLEVDHAKNSARLLQLSLANCAVLVGEVFDAQGLRAVLAGPKYTVLLYPQTVADACDTARSPDPQRLQDLAQLRLVVLDATWRKSRKMLHLSPLLQQLPRLSLDDVAPSRYWIRKAHHPDQLSTLEATCAALAQLDGNPERYQPLLQAFDGFVAQQMAFQPTRLDADTWPS
jgi:DTW domain-containing protein YfiP